MEWAIAISAAALLVAILAQVRLAREARRSRKRDAAADERVKATEARANEAHEIAVRAASAKLVAVSREIAGVDEQTSLVRVLVMNTGGGAAFNVQGGVGLGEVGAFGGPMDGGPTLRPGDRVWLEWPLPAEQVGPTVNPEVWPQYEITLSYADGMGEHRGPPAG